MISFRSVSAASPARCRVTDPLPREAQSTSLPPAFAAAPTETPISPGCSSPTVSALITISVFTGGRVAFGWQDHGKSNQVNGRHTASALIREPDSLDLEHWCAQHDDALDGDTRHRDLHPANHALGFHGSRHVVRENVPDIYFLGRSPARLRNVSIEESCW